MTQYIAQLHWRDQIDLLGNRNIFTSRLAFARALLAISTLGTLLFTKIEPSINEALLDSSYVVRNDFFLFRQISIFEIFSPQLAKVLAIILLLFAITGYLPQLSIFAQAWVHTSFCNSAIDIDGGDQIAANLCLLLIPICIMDKRTNQWRDSVEPKKQVLLNIFANTYFFLIKLQVAIIYLHAATGKLNVSEWLDGTCLYYWTTNNIYGAPLFVQKFYTFFTLSNFAPLLTWGVIALELGLFGCLFATNLYIRRSFLFLGILFHFVILLTHGLTAFFFSTAGALILFLDQENYLYIKLSHLLIKFRKIRR